MLQVSYVGSQGYHIVTGMNRNMARPEVCSDPAGCLSGGIRPANQAVRVPQGTTYMPSTPPVGVAPAQLQMRPNLFVGSTLSWFFNGTSSYHSGNVSLTKPEEYSTLTTTAVALHAIKLYPNPGRREEFEGRTARAKRWLVSAKAYSVEERSMQLIALADTGASASERAAFVKGLKGVQNPDGSWSQLPGMPGEAYATGEALYALHVAGDVPAKDAVYQKGIEWLLRNQLADGSWFVPTLAVPVQPHTFESGFPHGWSQFASEAGSSWAAMALLFTLPNKSPAN